MARKTSHKRPIKLIKRSFKVNFIPNTNDANVNASRKKLKCQRSSHMVPSNVKMQFKFCASLP